MVSTSGKAALGGNRLGAHVLRNFYFSADPNTGRGRQERGRRAYRERERDSDSERRNSARMSPQPLLDLLEPSREQNAHKRQAGTTPNDDLQETPRSSLKLLRVHNKR